MCHLSPTVHLAWAVLSCGLQIFLIQHLWRYDRFKCIAWSSGRQPGAFKRVMTYSYLTSVPAIVVYSISMAILKYRNGYTFIPGFGIIPTPFQLWSSQDRAWLFPLQLVFSIAWGLELVTHLEELTFWLFLLHQGPNRREWFASIEFRAWAISSLVAITGLPITVIVTRSDLLRSEAYLFLVGGSASACVTAVFFIVLARFPAFLQRVKREGATGPVILRLVKFHELNTLRVIFRLLMTVPLVILGVDGIRGHHSINTSLLWTDLLAFFAAVGTIASSTLTLVIFFPRSLDKDSNWLPQSTEILTHGSFYSGEAEHNRQSGTTLNAKPTSAGGYKLDADGNPFAHPRDAVSPTPLPISKGKYNYYTGHFTAPSALTTTYYPPSTLGVDSPAQLNTSNFDLRSIEGDGNEDRTNNWHMSDSETALNDSRGNTTVNDKGDQQYFENNDWYSASRATKDNVQPAVRMIELADAIDAGLKQPRKPPRLHPYIMSFTSPIDLLQYNINEEHIPRAI